MQSARDDFDSHSDESDVEDHAFCCVFNNGEPRMLLCQNHKGGSKLDYVHMPRYPRGMLPNVIPDQLAHAVVMPR
jgi:hypothetical protein